MNIEFLDIYQHSNFRIIRFLNLLYWERVYKTTKDIINTGHDIHENNYAPDPSIHLKKETNDAANHKTTQEVVD